MRLGALASRRVVEPPPSGNRLGRSVEIDDVGVDVQVALRMHRLARLVAIWPEHEVAGYNRGAPTDGALLRDGFDGGLAQSCLFLGGDVFELCEVAGNEGCNDFRALVETGLGPAQS